jgi:hypothetical protein
VNPIATNPEEVLTVDNIVVGLTVRHIGVNKCFAKITKVCRVALGQEITSFELEWLTKESTKGWTITYNISFAGVFTIVPCVGDIMVDSVSVRQEKPCVSCQRMNDIGVHVCWCCGSKP